MDTKMLIGIAAAAILVLAALIFIIKQRRQKTKQRQAEADDRRMRELDEAISNKSRHLKLDGGE